MAFVSGVLPARPCARRTPAVSPRAVRMMATGAAKPLKVNVDMKGKPVWTLRQATNADVAAIAAIEQLNFSEALVQSLVQYSEGSCLVAEVTLRGGEPGEEDGGSAASRTRLVGAVLVDVNRRFSDPNGGVDSPMVKSGDVVAIRVDQRMPEADDVRRKLLLGALRKLKSVPIKETYVTVAKNAPVEKLVQESGFQHSATHDEEITYYANVVTMNPDPQKKIS